MPGSFFDTNVLVYLASGDPLKANRAEEVISRGGTISVQVLNELTNAARRKMRMSWPEIRTFLSTLRELLNVQSITLDTHKTGLALAERYNFSTYDAMIAASAIEAGCDTLWSEDMQHGMVLEEGPRIVNPFRAATRTCARSRAMLACCRRRGLRERRSAREIIVTNRH